MQQFVDFQIQAADYVDGLIAMGVPDYHLAQLPGLYDALRSFSYNQKISLQQKLDHP